MLEGRKFHRHAWLGKEPVQASAAAATADIQASASVETTTTVVQPLANTASDVKQQSNTYQETKTMKKANINFTLRTWTGTLALVTLMGISCISTHSYGISRFG